MCFKAIALSIRDISALAFTVVLMLPIQNPGVPSPGKGVSVERNRPAVIAPATENHQDYLVAQSRKGIPRRRVGGGTRYTA